MEQESSRRVTQQGRTQQENPVWPRQSHPSLHKCGETPIFPLWDYFFFFSNATNSAAKKSRERAMRWGETKITGNGIKPEHRAWTGQGSSFVSWIGVWIRAEGVWGHRGDQEPGTELTGHPRQNLSPQNSSTFLQKGQKSQTSSSFQLFLFPPVRRSEAQCSCGPSQIPRNTKLSSCGFMQRKQL